MEEWNGFRVVGAVEDDTANKNNIADNSNNNENDLVSSLKTMLAEAYVLYHTIHGFHWNVKGEDFYEYHKLFDEIVDDIYEHIDPIAENILKLGEQAPFTMSKLVALSKLKETDLPGKTPHELATKFYSMNEEYIKHIKEFFNIANKDNEQGVANFIAERIDQHQKWSWFLKASIEG
jgi:starvation-inducible DNA-binding protein